MSARAHDALDSLRARVAGDAQASAIADGILVQERKMAAQVPAAEISGLQAETAASTAAPSRGIRPSSVHDFDDGDSADDSDSDFNVDEDVKRTAVLNSAALRRSAANAHRAAVSDEDLINPKSNKSQARLPAASRDLKRTVFPRMMDYGRLQAEFQDDSDEEAAALASEFATSVFMTDVLQMRVEPAPQPNSSGARVKM